MVLNASTNTASKIAAQKNRPTVLKYVVDCGLHTV